jgi:hypothetical protein
MSSSSQVHIFKPPTPTTLYQDHNGHSTKLATVFLAGSIEMGTATDWQHTLTSSLLAIHSGSAPESSPVPVAILNPRRDDWDSSWKQDISHPQFRQQVEWELDGLDNADVIAMYFDPNGKAPISLLELGLHARPRTQDEEEKSRMVVCCPEGFWRRGNVQIVCARYGIRLVETLEELTDEVARRLKQICEKRNQQNL